MQGLFGMERIEIENWTLDVEETEGGLSVRRAAARGAAAALPGALKGRPVAALSDHAFQAEENRGLRELRLPASLRSIGDYAFYGCSSLQSLHLSDRISSFGGGVFTSCRSLARFSIERAPGGQGPALSSILSELSRELEIELIEPDGEVGRLIFPEYREETTEVSGGQMVFFAYSIEGAGYIYHHCLKDRIFSYRAYDDLWDDYLTRGFSRATAVRQACYRLAWPRELSEAARGRYLSYLQKNEQEALLMMAQDREGTLARRVLFSLGASHGALAAGAEKARETGNREVLALILEEEHRRFPAPARKRYEL